MEIEYKEILDAKTVRVTTPDERWYLHPETKEWFASSTWISSYTPSKELAIWMAKKGWDEAELIKQEAGARGSRTHKALEILIAGGEIKHNEALTDGDGNFNELSVQEYDNIISFNDWVKETKPEFLASEKTVFNKKMKYAGTLDCIVKIDGIVYLIDFKTSANIYLSHQVQISSYLHADDIKADKIAILQLGYNKNKKKFKFTELEDKFRLFKSAYDFWEEANKNVTVKQKDYPLTIKLGV